MLTIDYGNNAKRLQVYKYFVMVSYVVYDVF